MGRLTIEILFVLRSVTLMRRVYFSRGKVLGDGQFLDQVKLAGAGSWTSVDFL